MRAEFAPLPQRRGRIADRDRSDGAEGESFSRDWTRAGNIRQWVNLHWTGDNHGARRHLCQPLPRLHGLGVVEGYMDALFGLEQLRGEPLG